MSDKDSQSWFKTWFNTEYYHILYADRDEAEATRFIEDLSIEIKRRFAPDRQLSVLDLACGKGRHAREFHAHGFDVSGVDLSEESIREARALSPAEIHFEVQDMRSLSLARKFDVIVNLFTSFGYFDDAADNRRVLETVRKHLNEGGIFVIDFLNLSCVERNLVPKETKEIGGIRFDLTRSIRKGMITKDIRFTDNGEEFHFQERVQALSYNDIQTMLTDCGFEILTTFGDYDLNAYSTFAPRAIFMAVK